MVALIVIELHKRSLSQISLSQSQLSIWAALAAALFILYPFHSEAVNVITCRMDPLVTLFSLFSLWCYIRWRNKSNLGFFILSIISAILAFLTKEMAVALPLTIFIYEVLFKSDLSDEAKATGAKSGRIKALYLAFKHTLPYWLILALYFVLRKFVLGDFIAGYPDSTESTSLIVQGWLRGLSNIFIPIDTSSIGTHSNIF